MAEVQLTILKESGNCTSHAETIAILLSDLYQSSKHNAYPAVGLKYNKAGKQFLKYLSVCSNS